MTMKLKMIIAMVFTWATMSLLAQQVSIKGTVTDAKDGSPMPGVNVIIKGTTKGTVTSVEGDYQISAPAGSVLVFSFVGYVNKEVALVGTESILNISLEVAVTGLDEIVVIGYGTVKKSDATGSVSVVSSKDFNKGSVSSPQDLIVGKTAGVVITSGGGAPGSKSTIRIRGGSSLSASNDPLVVIDGVPVDDSKISGVADPLSTINPNDIETFSVLKDASATAIYGSRASNGVIIITTKKGKKGFHIDYNVTASYYTLPNKIEVMTGDQFRELMAEKYPKPADSSILKMLGPYNTDWQDEIYRKAFGQDHNLSVSGMVKETPYRVSLGYTKQDGILINTGWNRTTVSLGVDPSFFDNHLKVNINAKGSTTESNFGFNDAVGEAVAFDPTQPVKDYSGKYAKYDNYFTWVTSDTNQIDIATTNPVAHAMLTDNVGTVNRFIGNTQFDYKFHFLPELRANLNLGYDAYKASGHDNAPATASWTIQNKIGQIKDYYQDGKNELLDFYLNYTKDLNIISSKIDITAGYSWQHFYKDDSVYKTNLARDYVTETKDEPTEYFLVSFFGRLNYSFLDKYLITATLRDDGTSRFSPEARWGLFPSIAFAWKMLNEPFIKNISSLSDLKLRLGYGITGQQKLNIDNFPNDYSYMATYKTSDEKAQYKFGDIYYYTLRPNPYDNDLKWEETTTTNIGLDFGLFRDRITGSVDAYYRETNDMINRAVVAAGTNFSNYILTNIGNMEIKGFEFTIEGKIISTKDMLWQVGYNFSYNETKITKLNGSNDPTYLGDLRGDISGGVGNKVQINSLGYPANSFFLLQQVYYPDGMPIEGVYMRKSENSNLSLNDNASKSRDYKPAPDYTMGISTRFEYKNFEFSCSGRANIGNYVYNNVASSNDALNQSFTSVGFFNNRVSSYYKTKFREPQYWSDIYVENASFFRMDNITIGYNFNNIINEKTSVHLTASVQNAFVITNYTGLDPEVESGIDKNIYPRPRTYMLGLKVNF
jgi:TonB-dependent starch-binding outer membrane protein SusC